MPRPRQAVGRVLTKCHADLQRRRFFRSHHGSKLDSRLRPDFRESTRPAKSPSPIGASTAGPSTTTGARTAECPAFVSRKLGFRSPGAGLGARRRQHRRQRRGEAADHRRVPVIRQCRRATRAVRGATGTDLGGASRRARGHLAGPRHRGRRHARPRRRSGALHFGRHRGHRGRAR